MILCSIICVTCIVVAISHTRMIDMECDLVEMYLERQRNGIGN